MSEDLNSRQAAELLGVNINTVRRLADDGALPYRRTSGGHRRFAEQDVLAYRAHPTDEQAPGAAARAAAWRRAAGLLLAAAERDLRSSPELSPPFARARAELRRRR